MTLDDSCGRVMPPPNVRLVIPALAGIVAVRAKAQPSGVVLIGFLIPNHFRAVAVSACEAGDDSSLVAHRPVLR